MHGGEGMVELELSKADRAPRDNLGLHAAVKEMEHVAVGRNNSQQE